MIPAVIILLVVIVLIAVGLYIAYRQVYYSGKKDPTEVNTDLWISNKKHHEEILRRTEILSQVDYEAVSVRSYDGLTLAGRYYHHDDSAPLCICCHGYKGAGIRDFCVMGKVLIDDGYNVLIINHRGHGRSGGHTITYGVKERIDVLSWIGWANERFSADHPIVLFGISMGAATVLMASGLDLPENVKAISADCPYNRPKDIIWHVMRRMKLNPKLLWLPAWLAGVTYGRVNLNAACAADAVKKTKIPILIIHGENDTFVPMEMSKEVQDANPDMVERHTFPGAAHGLSYFEDPERYLRIVRGFLARVLNEK